MIGKAYNSGDEVREANTPMTPFSPQQELFKDLYSLEPNDCLDNIASRLQKMLNCETVCILLWNEVGHKLITEHRSGLPRGLQGPEEYGPNEGITGKVIFSEARLIQCVIDISQHYIYDKQTQSQLDGNITNWHNMLAYEREAGHAFRSLVGAPLFVRNQKLGVVKLINKKDADGQLDEEGFSDKDIETLLVFLDGIEHVVALKTNEKQVKALLDLGQKIVGTASDSSNIRNDIAAKCADALNFRICIIRLREEDCLKVKGSNLEEIRKKDQLEDKLTPASQAVKRRVPLKGSFDPGRSDSTLQVQPLEGTASVDLALISHDFIEFLYQYELKSFLIVPIIERGIAVGSIECYCSQPREFFTQELNAIRLYVNALFLTTRQQQLLTSLIELQRLGVVADKGEGQEKRVINGLLRRVRELLELAGRRAEIVAVILSKRSLAQSKLKCDEFYGASEDELEATLGSDFHAILRELNSPEPPILTSKTDNYDDTCGEIKLVKERFSLEQSNFPFGVFLLALDKTEIVGDFLGQLAQLAANYLSVMLGNLEELEQSKGLLRIIDDASLKETLKDTYQSILDQTIQFFGFDFGTISQVDQINQRIETEMVITKNPFLVDPTAWMTWSNYGWNDNDILVDVFKQKEDVIINALKPGEERDPRLNELIFDYFDHKNLARIWVPFIFRRSVGPTGRDDDLVLGIIEAGFHRSTLPFIPKPKREIFVKYVHSCANALQRVTFLEERKSIDDILRRFNDRKSPEQNPEEILRELLKDAVELVGAKSGDITFLSHRDNKLRFSRENLLYRVPEDKRYLLVRELDLDSKDKIGIVGQAAKSEKAYWANNVDKDPHYVKEFDDVKSEMAVPLRFSGQTIGVLNINSASPDWFDQQKANLVQTVADQVTVLYQKARIVAPLYKLVSPFNPFSRPEEIYATVIRIIEGFLETETVSVWRKEVLQNTFKLDLVAASKQFKRKYDEAGISTLKFDSFTGQVAGGEDYIQINHDQIKTGRQFIHKQFAEDNKLRSMTAVPIRAGDEIYGAIDVFSRRDTELFTEEVIILRILAGKAAIALQSATLLQTFNEISTIAPHEDIKEILRRIAKKAVEVLHAEPVILFRYDAAIQRFDADAVVGGKLIWENVQIVPNENDMANMVLKLPSALYLKNEQAYLRFEQKCNRKWHSERFKEDFWHREKIKSFAAIKLEHRKEIVGVMFINYRDRHVSPSSIERLMKVFASQAASAIYNAKIFEENKQFWNIRRADSLSLTVSEIVYSLAHNSGHLLNQINDSFGKIEQLLKKTQSHDQVLPKLKEEVEKVKEPLDAILNDFDRLKDYRQLDELRLEAHDINQLVKRSLDMIRDTMISRRIAVEEKYTSNLPPASCDDKQIQHVLLNLFLNAIEAMDNKGKLSVTTGFDRNTDEIEIRVSDTGPGIPKENRDKVFEPHFTTKKLKAGSGFGLPISRYIVHEHGGHIEMGPSGKGATFTVYLPVHYQESANGVR